MKAPKKITQQSFLKDPENDFRPQLLTVSYFYACKHPSKGIVLQFRHLSRPKHAPTTNFWTKRAIF